MDLTETVLERQEIYSGRIVHLHVDKVQLADGMLSQREIVEHSGAVCLVAVLEGDILMVRQFRLAAGGPLLEIPAGTLEAGEEPALCAARELVEETGYRAENLEPLGAFFVAPGYSSEKIHAYLATGLMPASAHADADERIILERFPIAEAERMALEGGLEDAKSIASILIALPRLRRIEPS